MHEGKYYSQGEEEKYIMEYFGNYKGTVLEIGAYHHEAFSNSKRLIMNGWKAVLVEPDPQCYPALQEYYKNNPRVTVVPLAIGDYDGELDFMSNAGALATASIEHYNRWKGIDPNFKQIKVPVVSWRTFLSKYPGPYDFISIDTEGMDSIILHQIDLDETQTKMICVEFTYDPVGILNYLIKYDFQGLYKNSENLIGIRRYKLL